MKIRIPWVGTIQIEVQELLNFDNWTWIEWTIFIVGESIAVIVFTHWLKG